MRTSRFVSVRQSQAEWRSRLCKSFVLASAILVGTAACSKHDLLDVETDIVTPTQAANPSGALALRAAALRQFAIYTAGSPQVRAWLMDALFTDQLVNARQDFNDLDQRKWSEEVNPHGVNVWDDYATITYAVPTAITAMKKYLPDDNTRKSYIGELYAIRGLSTTILAASPARAGRMLLKK